MPEEMNREFRLLRGSCISKIVSAENRSFSSEPLASFQKKFKGNPPQKRRLSREIRLWSSEDMSDSTGSMERHFHQKLSKAEARQRRCRSEIRSPKKN